MIAPEEDKAHSSILTATQVDFQPIVMDGRLLNAAQTRVNLASKVVEASESERRVQQNNGWFRRSAQEAGLDLDEDLLEDHLGDGDKRDRSKLAEAKKARRQLQQLLREPLQTQRFGKFLSTNSAHRQKVLLK